MSNDKTSAANSAAKLPSPFDQFDDPSGAADESVGWQARKSAQTRNLILETAIDCLCEVGYANTTTQLIAKRADISRGAMLHHYSTRLELIASVIEYTFYVRLKKFREQIAGLSEADRVGELVGLELTWEGLQTREYTAYLELLVASRTDPELKAIFEPASHRYLAVWQQVVLEVFPEWRDRPKRLQLASDFTNAALEGLLLIRDQIPQRSRRVAVRQLLNAVILQLREGELEPADHPKK